MLPSPAAPQAPALPALPTAPAPPPMFGQTPTKANKGQQASSNLSFLGSLGQATPQNVGSKTLLGA